MLQGEVNAFEELVRAHKAHVLKIVCSMVGAAEAEELAHEVFVKAYRDLSGYSRKAPFEHWLAKIAVHTCHDFWRKKRRDRLVPAAPDDLSLLEHYSSGTERIETVAVGRARELLDRVLAHLTPEDRLAFTLLYLEELSMKEVAQELGWSVARVKIRSFRARRALKKVLENELRG